MDIPGATAEAEPTIVQAVTAVLAEAGKEQAEVSVLVTGDERIQELNREWRGVDEPTDVLSFALAEGEDEPALAAVPDAPEILGDVVISWPRAEVQAAEYGHPLRRELAFLAVHGTLHLLGYDHEKGVSASRAMREAEEAILSGLGLGRQISE